MDDEVCEFVDRRWVRKHPEVHGHQEIHLIRVPDGRYKVRQVGPVHRPDIVCPNPTQALAAVMRLMAADWTEASANVSPPVRYGVSPSAGASSGGAADPPAEPARSAGL